MDIMATIRLQDVTKTFPPATYFDRWGHGKGLAGHQSDRAFAERAAAQAAQPAGESPANAGPVVALDRVSLTVPHGQTMAVVGPSGCGKSTLLRVVAGLEPDFTGHVYYDDQDTGQIHPKDRYIGMVFQNYALYPHFLSQGNLGFFFKMHKATDAEAEERIRVTSEIMGIGFKELLPRKPGTLSGGQQQRVAIARALVRNPRLFLFDEPLSSLDAKLRAQTRVEVKRLLNRFKITALYVTHDQAEAITLGDQVAVMRAGRIEQAGIYHRLRQYPANTFVAGFLGSPPMNLFRGGTVSDGLLHLGGIKVPLPPAVLAQVHAGQTVTLGVRPEAAQLLGEAQPAPAGIRLRGNVEVVEPDFAHHTQLAHVRSGALQYVGMGSLDPLLTTGDEVEVVFRADQLYFFDGQSERRLG
jgi:multiple sugar transport system ATP-binding protein